MSRAGPGPACGVGGHDGERAGDREADDGFGLNDDENFGLMRPIPAKGRPEDPIQPVQLRSRTLSFEHCELLP